MNAVSPGSRPSRASRNAERDQHRAALRGQSSTARRHGAIPLPRGVRGDRDTHTIVRGGRTGRIVVAEHQPGHYAAAVRCESDLDWRWLGHPTPSSRSINRTEFGRRSGSSSTNTLDDAGLRAAVQMAERIAKLSPEDPEALPELGPQRYQPGVNWSDATASQDPATRAEAVKRIAGNPAKSAGPHLHWIHGSDHQRNGHCQQQGPVPATTSVHVIRAHCGGRARPTAASPARAQNDASQLIEDQPRVARRARRRRHAPRSIPWRSSRAASASSSGRRRSAISCSSSPARSARAAPSKASGLLLRCGWKELKIGQKVVDERVTIFSDPFGMNVAWLAVQW